HPGVGGHYCSNEIGMRPSALPDVMQPNSVFDWSSLELVRIQQPGSMMNRDESNLFLPHPEHHAIAAQDDFPDCWIRGLRNDPTRIRECCDAIQSTKNIGNEKAGVLRRVLSDELNDSFQVLRGLGRPFYFNHFLIFSFIV
ncbi:MAG: hypothetical protein AAB578_09215, partial [Elusimicrobiota bacterium]